MDWHERYARFPRPFGEDPTPFLREVFECPARFNLPTGPLRIFCPGDGYGRNGLWLARHGHSVVGLDLVPSAVSSALVVAGESELDYVAIPADISSSPFPIARQTRFDAIVSAWMRLPDRTSRVAWNAECARRLRQGGRIVFVGGSRVTDAATEMGEWPSSVTWRDFSDEDEVRLVGDRDR